MTDNPDTSIAGMSINGFAEPIPLPKDNFAELVTRLVRERGHEMWPHLPEKFPRPMRKPRTRRFTKPFQPASRPSSLRHEAARLHSAMAFMMWQYGVVMNAHMTIAWAELGIRDHRRAADLLPLFNHEAAKWLAVGASSRLRKRTSARSAEEGTKHFWIYVHENARDQGFHTHQLMHIPVTKEPAFADWARSCLGRLAGRSPATETAVYLSPMTKKRGFRPHDGGNEHAAIAHHWRWFRYLIKSLHPDHRERVPGSFVEVAARDIFRPDEPFTAMAPVACPKIAGCSENISEAARRRAKFRSRFEVGDWAALYEGYEVGEHWQRLRDEAHAREMEEVMNKISI